MSETCSNTDVQPVLGGSKILRLGQRLHVSACFGLSRSRRCSIADCATEAPKAFAPPCLGAKLVKGGGHARVGEEHAARRAVRGDVALEEDWSVVGDHGVPPYSDEPRQLARLVRRDRLLACLERARHAHAHELLLLRREVGRVPARRA
eukprot:6201488-Pleurochrysis_carterae.AAC.1